MNAGVGKIAEREALTAEYVRQILDYNPETGEFRWKERTPEMFEDTSQRSKNNRCAIWNGRYAGSIAGGINGVGYRFVWVDRRRPYLAHRLAWLYMIGEWPKNEIDHIDGDSLNNRFSNLREATRSENEHNTGVRSNNTSGYKGVCWNGKASKWQSQIMVRRRKIYLGIFDRIEDAAAAYAKAARELHGDFARLA